MSSHFHQLRPPSKYGKGSEFFPLREVPYIHVVRKTTTQNQVIHLDCAIFTKRNCVL